MSRAGSVQEIVDLLATWGDDPYDEEIGQLDHALQTAALAAAADAGDQLVVAALLHDIGHLLDLRSGEGQDVADRMHEVTGAAWLRPLLGPRVTVPILLHVRAKRYLCATDPAYVGLLSEGSRRSLEMQGGPMSPEEVGAFDALAGSADAIALRRWDDTAKVDGRDVPPLASYVARIEGAAASSDL